MDHATLEFSNKHSSVRDSQHARESSRDGPLGLSLTLTFIYKVPTRLSRIIKAVFRWVRLENRVLLPPSSHSFFLSLAHTHSLQRRSVSLADRSRVYQSPFDCILIHWSLLTGECTSVRSLDFHSPLKMLFKIRFSVYSKPWAELRLQNCGSVSPAHYSKMVQQIRHRRRFSMPRLPQIQNMLGRAGLSCEVIDVPIIRTKTPAVLLPRKVVVILLIWQNRARLGKI